MISLTFFVCLLGDWYMMTGCEIVKMWHLLRIVKVEKEWCAGAGNQWSQDVKVLCSKTPMALWASNVSWKLKFSFPSILQPKCKDDLSTWRWTSCFLSRLGECLLSPALMTVFFGTSPLTTRCLQCPSHDPPRSCGSNGPPAMRAPTPAKKRRANPSGLAHRVSTYGPGLAHERQLSLRSTLGNRFS